MKYQAIREEIKRLSAAQVNLKPQRKTVYFTGTRALSPEQATMSVLDNRFLLRHLFIAYAKLRNVERPLPKNKPVDMGIVNGYLEKYAVPIISDQVA